MRKVAVFGNAGGGKSTLARRLAEAAGLPLYPLDELEYPDGRYRRDLPDGGRIGAEAFARLHDDILARDAWVIDGFGSVELTWRRMAAADTLVYLDLPLASHYAGVTRRLWRGLFAPPLGWPVDSPLWASSWQSYRVVWLCHTRLTPRYRQRVADAKGQNAHHLRSRAQADAFLRDVERGAT